MYVHNTAWVQGYLMYVHNTNIDIAEKLSVQVRNVRLSINKSETFCSRQSKKIGNSKVVKKCKLPKLHEPEELYGV